MDNTSLIHSFIQSFQVPCSIDNTMHTPVQSILRYMQRLYV